MNDNERFFTAYHFLKRKGHIRTFSQLAEILETNKSGVEDLKNGKTKVSIENIRNMIKSYPEISLRWLVLEEGDVEIKVIKELDLSMELFIMQKEKIQDLKDEIDDLEKELNYKNVIK